MPAGWILQTEFVEEALAVAAMRLKLLVPCDAMAFFACEDGLLRSKLADRRSGFGVAGFAARPLG